MNTNYTNKTQKLIYPELSYAVAGICFGVQNEIGRFAREKQYADLIEDKLRSARLDYKREHQQKNGNIFDFIIENKIILEIKAKRLILKEDYYQIQRYLQMSNKRLGLLVNFRNRYLKPIRVVRIETSAKHKFLD